MSVTDNPYQSPQAAEEPMEQEPERRGTPIRASHGLGGRFLAANLDNSVAALLFFVAAMGLANDEQPVQVLPLLAAFSAYLGYFFLSEWLLGTSPFKFCFRLHVRQLSGEPCTARQIAIRTAMRVLEINPVLLGGLPAGLSILATRHRHRQRLGDLLAGTVVVRK